MAALVERFGAVVHRDALAATGWPEGSPGRNALDVHMLRLRRRIAPVGLAVRTIRARGYLLEASDSGVDGLGDDGSARPKHARHTTDCDT
jgi:DNA-binding winged helix-turn-helix (wHTH) protein